MNKNYLFIFVLLSIIAFSNCDRVKNPIKNENNDYTGIQYKNELLMNPENISDRITIDRQGNVWFLTVVKDTSVYVPSESSYLPTITKICMYDYQNYYIMYDNIKSSINELIFDNDENIWLFNSKKLIKIDKNHNYSDVLTLGDHDGLFQTFAVDHDNNVWIGGLGTGLYKYSNGNLITFNTENSILPTNSMTKIYIDNQNIVWVALWDLEGILKIENDTWKIYNCNNSTITQDNIWEIKVDNNQRVWIGTGWVNPDISLMMFDGLNWIENNPKDLSGNHISGTVRHIETDLNGRLWTISEKVENLDLVNTILNVYNGESWENIDNVAKGNIITDIEHFDNKLVLATCNQIYTIE